MDDVTVAKFQALFSGFADAYGTGSGGWIHKSPTTRNFRDHLSGRGDSLGIGPLMPDGKCRFASIDLDRPDFSLARTLMSLLPGVSWLERSRSGNAHIHVFFNKPCDGWVARGILRMACEAVGERQIEVFPKTDKLLAGMVGNYINLPYFGDTRPIIGWSNLDPETVYMCEGDEIISLPVFVRLACRKRNDPMDWVKRARFLQIEPPEVREAKRDQNFGESPNLHICAQHVIEHREDNPVTAGHRAVVYFSLSKMLGNWSEINDEEALEWLTLVNEASPDPISPYELHRIYRNATRGRFTSTGCDDPLFHPYRHPDCRIGER